MISERLRGFSVDTAVVSLLLAIELGRTASTLSIDAVLVAVTLLIVSVLPYFLTEEAPTAVSWLIGRSAVGAIGVTAGVSLGASGSHAPMSLLIVAALVSCSIQFYSLFKLRLAD